MAGTRALEWVFESTLVATWISGSESSDGVAAKGRFALRDTGSLILFALTTSQLVTCHICRQNRSLSLSSSAGCRPRLHD